MNSKSLCLPHPAFFVWTALAIGLALPSEANAHCDTLDGPVVMDARSALEFNDVTPTLKWVAKEDEVEIRDAFQKTLHVRKLGEEAKELADRHFFETLVRVHRAGEGAPYDGLKPAGSIEPPIAAADKAMAVGDVDRLAVNIAKKAEESIRERFLHLTEKQKTQRDSVEAGREFVHAYVLFVHHVEGLHNILAGEGDHH